MFLPDNQVASISLASALKQKKVIIFRFLKMFSPLEQLSISDMGYPGEWTTLIKFEFKQKDFICLFLSVLLCMSCKLSDSIPNYDENGFPIFFSTWLCLSDSADSGSVSPAINSQLIWFRQTPRPYWDPQRPALIRSRFCFAKKNVGEPQSAASADSVRMDGGRRRGGGGAGSDSVSPRVQLVDKPDQSDGKS